MVPSGDLAKGWLPCLLSLASEPLSVSSTGCFFVERHPVCGRRWLSRLVSGGTLGNLYDRLGLHGVQPPGATKPALAVRDFLHFQFGNYDYPIFNIADSCLVAGAIMLMLQSLKSVPAETLSRATTNDAA